MTHFAGKMVRMLLLSAISTVLLAGFAAAAESQQAVAVGATTGSSLRLRADASTSASVITTLDQDVAVAVLDDSIDGWYKVNYNGNVGYVSADYLVIDQDNVFTSYGRVSGDGVNVRSAPSTSGGTLATVNDGAMVTVNGFVDGWYDVTCEYGTEGYIRSDFLVLTNSSSSSSDIVSLAKQYLAALPPAALTAPVLRCTSTARWDILSPTLLPASGRAVSAPRYGALMLCSPVTWCFSMIPAAMRARPAPM